MNTNLEIKELSLCHKLKYSIFYIFADYRIHGLKYLRTTTSSHKDTGIGKSEFVAKTQFLCSKRKQNWS